MTSYRPPEGRPTSPHLPFGDRRDAPWYGQSIISVRQFQPADLDYVFGVAHEMREMVGRVGTFDLLKGKLLANLFYEPSTRTASSFMAAMQRLGGTVIPINEVRYSSVSKGESLPDTIRTLECYADCIVLRHPQMGAAAEAAAVARKPIINAGDGVGEHPTQALLDLFTIAIELGRYSPRTGLDLSGLTITLLGDLKYGRTVHSLSRLLAPMDVRLNFVSPPTLRMPEHLMTELATGTARTTELDALDPVLADSDVLYVTRVQKERFEDVALYESLKHAFVIDRQTLTRARDTMIVMHPFPRVGEIAYDVDPDPRAAYFRQMENGMYVRMALLAMVLGKA
ncbi:MAG: aspartate carbamoyltransferase [Deltaproteobacteria bacterium]|nr:aspartate carbamoyltransferase [Deltaproteobacteria bacterium]